MNKTICNFATLRFRPFPETEEFACFGVVMLCANTKQFDYRIGSEAKGRISHFFGELDDSVFRDTLKHIHEVLEGIKNRIEIINAGGDFFEGGTPDGLFDNLIRPRENIVKFSPPYTVVCDDPQAELQRQYENIVCRAFVVRDEYAEHVMRVRVRACLDALRIPYKQKYALEYGSIRFAVPFFLHDNENRAIKPLNLAQKTPVEIFDLAAKWGNRLALMHEEFTPSRILMPIRMPDPTKHELFDTANEALGKLGHAATLFTVTDEEQEKATIRRFAFGSL